MCIAWQSLPGVFENGFKLDMKKITCAVWEWPGLEISQIAAV